jgi:hypothetical protein
MATPLRRATCASLLLLALVALPAGSQDSTRTLTGSYAIAGKEAVDPPPGQPNDTHLQLFLTGRAAKDLYNALKVKATPDECTGHNARSKFQGGIACTMQEGGKEYECSFAVDLKNQKLDAIYDC